MNLYCFENARTPEQLAEMERLERLGICLFCPEAVTTLHSQPIHWEGEHWTVISNAFPYNGTSLHLLLVPKVHVSDMIDLPSEAQQEFWTALSEIRQIYGLTHYGLGVRSGDCRYTGATIRHVHAHLLVGAESVDAEGQFAPIRMRFSSIPGRKSQA